MKTMKKVMALVLSLVMMLALGVTAFATKNSNTFTITAPATRHQYEIYQIFTGDLSGTTLSNVKWGANGKNENDSVTVGDPVPQTVLDALMAVSSETEAKKLDVIKKYATLTKPVATISNDATYEAAAGYYLIKDKDKYLKDQNEAYTTYIVQVSEDMTITPKSAKPSVDKQVWDETGDAESGHTNGWGESADHAINERFQFKLTATLTADKDYAAYPTYKVVFNDTMSKGVTFESIASVSVDGVTVGATGYNCTAKAGQAGGSWSLTIEDIKSISGVNIVDGAVIEVIYNAYLNEKAKVNNTSGDTTNQNKVYLQYSNNPNASGNGELGKTPEDSVWVFTYEVDNTKVDGSAEGKPALAGAGFRLYNSTGETEIETEIALIYDDSISAYRPIKAGETGVEMKSADGTGVFNIKGLDAGTYVLKETSTPSGYNTCDPVTVIISATHAENAEGTGATTTLTNTSTMKNTIENKKGSTLPSTGGMGTTIFYVVGTILVLAAVVLLITKKRMHADK